MPWLKYVYACGWGGGVGDGGGGAGSLEVLTVVSRIKDIEF